MKYLTSALRAALVAGLLLGLGASRVCADNLKVGTVDIKRLFDEYWKTGQDNIKLKNQRDEIVKDRDAIIEKMKQAEQAYKKQLEAANDSAISPEQREKSKKAAEDQLIELRRIQSAFEQFDNTARQTLAETEARMKNNILKELREAISAKAKAGGYNLILDSSASSVVMAPVFLYSNLEDLTTTLLTELNAKAPAGALEEKAPAAPAPALPLSPGREKTNSLTPLNLPSAGGKQ